MDPRLGCTEDLRHQLMKEKEKLRQIWKVSLYYFI